MPHRLGRLPAFLLLVAAATPARGDECNAYFPLRPDARWVYSEGAAGTSQTMLRTITVMSVAAGSEVTTAELQQQVSLPGRPDVIAGTAITRVRCDASGVTLTVEGSAGVGGETSGVIKAKLPGLPPDSDLKPGFSWRGDTEVETMDAGARVVAQGARGSRVEGVESVTVPAGTFPDALKVATVQTLTLQRGKDTRYARQQLLEWYVRGVGLVKRETRTSQGKDAAGSIEQLQSHSGLTSAPASPTGKDGTGTAFPPTR
ncbi:MAG: hypothetical protein FJ148_05810 [Deltaproteobacteria bacterium]|nr:hypothetical protein [Deltaproteobacteria bacterium]